MNKANFTHYIAKKYNLEILVIIDEDTGRRSVVSDMENVLQTLASILGPKIYTMPVIYRDGRGIYDGIIPDPLTFYPINTPDEDFALCKAYFKRRSPRK